MNAAANQTLKGGLTMFYVGDVLWLENVLEDYGYLYDTHYTGIVQLKQGITFWYKDGYIHRSKSSPGGEGPAKIFSDRVPIIYEWWFNNRHYGDGVEKPSRFPE